MIIVREGPATLVRNVMGSFTPIFTTAQKRHIYFLSVYFTFINPQMHTMNLPKNEQKDALKLN